MSNNTAHRNESYYMLVTYLPPAILYILLIVISNILACCSKQKYKKIFYVLSKAIYGSNLVEKVTEEGETLYFLWNLQVPTLLKIPGLPIKKTGFGSVFVFSTTLIVFCGLFMITWTVFLTDMSDRCDASYDCYGRNGTYIEDCDEYMDERVSCYRFVYRYDLAIGAAGGTITLASTIFELYANFFIPILRNMEGKTPFHRCASFFIILYTPIVILMIGLFVIIFSPVSGVNIALSVLYLITAVYPLFGVSLVLLVAVRHERITNASARRNSLGHPAKNCSPPHPGNSHNQHHSTSEDYMQKRSRSL